MKPKMTTSKDDNCQMCHLLLTSHEDETKKAHTASNNNNNNSCYSPSLRNYTSLLSLNNHQHARRYHRFTNCTTSDHQHQCNNNNNNMNKTKPIDLDLCQFKRASNHLAFKAIAIIFVHFSFVYIAITSCRYVKIARQTCTNALSSTQTTYVFSIYLLVYFVIVTFPRSRSNSPLNYILFAVYTLVTSILYANLSVNSSGAQFGLVSLVLTIFLMGQVFLLAFAVVQAKFTLFSRPCLPYIYVYALFAASLVVFLLLIHFALELRLVAIRNWLVEDVLLINAEGKLNWRTFSISILVGCFFVFYEIFDLQFVLANLESSDSSSEAGNFFLIAFNLLTVDFFKLFLVFISFLLNLIK